MERRKKSQFSTVLSENQVNLTAASAFLYVKKIAQQFKKNRSGQAGQ